jgi:DNA repair exonuclease SbcCD ATPase subunit
VLSRDKNIFFDQLQQRQAELESSQYHLESLQSQNTELQYQLREANDRLALLSEELLDARREQDAKSQGPTTSAEDVARLLSASQVKYESRIGDLKRNLDTMERERNEGEAEWSRKLREKSRETDDLRRASEMSAKAWEQKEYIIKELKAEKGRLLEEISMYRTQVSDFQILSNKMKDVEVSILVLIMATLFRTN